MMSERVWRNFLFTVMLIGMAIAFFHPLKAHAQGYWSDSEAIGAGVCLGPLTSLSSIQKAERNGGRVVFDYSDVDEDKDKFLQMLADAVDLAGGRLPKVNVDFIFYADVFNPKNDKGIKIYVFYDAGCEIGGVTEPYTGG